MIQLPFYGEDVGLSLPPLHGFCYSWVAEERGKRKKDKLFVFFQFFIAMERSLSGIGKLTPVT